MKELSIEEKAKAYDEALEKARQLCAYPTTKPFISDLQDLFPELKENEDERIRKCLLSHFSRYQQQEVFLNDITMGNIVSWLEKQGKQKYIPKYKIGVYVKNTNYKGEPIYEIVYMDKECYICEYRGKKSMGDKAVMHFSFDNPYLRLVQKPVDKVEPKFKFGDWIVYNDNLYHIGNIALQRYYECLRADGTVHTFSVDIDSKSHLWTIQDAKDGDVLYENDTNTVLIFKSQTCGRIKVYCDLWININKFTGTCPVDYGRVSEMDLKPATKEQRDQLEKAMTDAGYTFDFEKKELKKIEQKPIEWHREDEQNLNACLGYIQDEFLRRWLTDAIHVKYDKPAWSEEDERYINIVVSALSSPSLERLYHFNKVKSNDIINWCESLKDRVQPQEKRKWSEEDEKMRNRAIFACNLTMDRTHSEGHYQYQEAIDWLKALPIEFIKNPNYNEDMVELLIGELRQIANENKAPKQYDKEIEWLKSLRPQKQWKPSNKQMKAIEHICDGNYNVDLDVLDSIYRDFKKLKEK